MPQRWSEGWSTYPRRQRRLWEHWFGAFQYLKKAYKIDRDRLFSRLVAVGLREDRFRLGTRTFYDEGGETLDQVALGGGKCLIPGNIQGWMWWGSEQPDRAEDVPWSLWGIWNQMQSILWFYQTVMPLSIRQTRGQNWWHLQRELREQPSRRKVAQIFCPAYYYGYACIYPCLATHCPEHSYCCRRLPPSFLSWVFADHCYCYCLLFPVASSLNHSPFCSSSC